MPVKRSKKLAIIQRRQRVADLYLQGLTQTTIAEHLGTCQSIVCDDLKAIRAQWQESSVRDFDTAREVELRRIDRIQAEASEAWEKSKQPEQAATVSGEGSVNQKVRKSVKNRHGDPRFLDIMLKCVASRRAILGLDAPMEIAPVLPDGQDAAQVVVAQLSVTELRVLKRLKEKAAPIVDGEVIPNGEVIDAADAACLVQD